jgi:hypothetical protein
MSGAIPPLPQYALRAWCSVKAQGQLDLCFLPLPTDRIISLSNKHNNFQWIFLAGEATWTPLTMHAILSVVCAVASPF